MLPYDRSIVTKRGSLCHSGLVTSVLKMVADRRSYRLKKAPKCLLFRSLRAVMARGILSMELLYFTGKTNWFREAVKPLKPYKNEDKHILQETGRGERGNIDI